MHKAHEKTISSKPYAFKLRTISQNLIGRIEEGKHPYLSERKEGKILLLLFSADKGLCGSLNTNLLREFLRFIDENKDFEVASIGRKLTRAVVRLEKKLIADFPFGTTVPLFETVLPLTNIIVDGFLKGVYKNVACIFTQFISLSMQKPTTLILLPIQKEQEEEILGGPYLFEPNASELLSSIMPHYLEMSLYQILLESYASEQAARMIAMHAASENASDVISELSLYYNKARQERITNELLDIVGGIQKQEVL